ncbi:hypothetical protein [Pandoraea anhela]|uniref:Uncharacterized protein n=1 Tax=Pandoraea anhela TaxID=2508295 RepID=A0A5E4SMC5_9BURK|nr:hypothetical protein [Pandoraea anhela]VVD76907.1 hypothetical protein PAN31108_00906 [Pandoraea anhela]
MSMNLSLQSVATRSAATLSTLEESKDAYAVQGKRIGINKSGELVIFKGSKYLLHPHQCQRAKALMTQHNLSTETPSSLIASLKFTDLRMDRTPVANLLAQLTSLKAPGGAQTPAVLGASEPAVSTPPMLTLDMVVSDTATETTTETTTDTAPQVVLRKKAARSSDDGSPSDASQRSLQLKRQSAMLRWEFAASRILRDPDAALSDVPPALPRKENRASLIASVNQAQTDAKHSMSSDTADNRPVPMPRTVAPQTAPQKPPRTFTFDRREPQPPVLSRSGSESSSGMSEMSESSAQPASTQSSTPVSRTTSVQSDESGAGTSGSSGASGIIDDLRNSGRATDALIQSMLRTQNLR